MLLEEDYKVKFEPKLIMASFVLGVGSMILLLILLMMIIGLDQASEIILGQWSSIFFFGFSITWYAILLKKR